MESVLFRGICRLGIFVICVQTITHFRPNQSYEKYIKLLSGIMILLQIVIPINQLFHRGGAGNLEERIWQIQEEISMQAEDTVARTCQADLILEKMTLAEVDRLLAEQEQESGEMQERETQDVEMNESGMTDARPVSLQEGAQEQGEDIIKIKEVEKVETVTVEWEKGEEPDA